VRGRANLVFPTVVGSVNGLRNTSLGVAADPGFDELTDALTRIQRAGNIGILVEARKEGGGVLAVIRRAERGTELGEDSQRVRKLLGLGEDVSEFEITYGLAPRNPNEVAMLTRSMMEIMLQLGFGIDLPAAHATGDRALPGQRRASVRERSRRRMPIRRCRTGATGTGSMTPISRARAGSRF